MKCPECRSEMEKYDNVYKCFCGTHVFMGGKVYIASIEDADYDFQTRVFTPKHIGEPVELNDSSFSLTIPPNIVPDEIIDIQEELRRLFRDILDE